MPLLLKQTQQRHKPDNSHKLFQNVAMISNVGITIYDSNLKWYYYKSISDITPLYLRY